MVNQEMSAFQNASADQWISPWFVSEYGISPSVCIGQVSGHHELVMQSLLLTADSSADSCREVLGMMDGHDGRNNRLPERHGARVASQHVSYGTSYGIRQPWIHPFAC